MNAEQAAIAVNRLPDFAERGAFGFGIEFVFDIEFVAAFVWVDGWSVIARSSALRFHLVLLLEFHRWSSFAADFRDE